MRAQVSTRNIAADSTGPDKPKKKPRYAGRLAKPDEQTISPDFVKELVDIGRRGGGENEINLVSANIKAAREAELMILLLEHYGISGGGSNTWFQLALALARDHVPAFDPQRKRAIGRPPKGKSLAMFIKQFLPKKKPGRPATRNARYSTLPGEVEKIKIENGLSGRGADKKALEILLATNRRGVVSGYQKILSEARGKIPKTPKKST